MARPERNNVDYFPFICDEGKKMFYLEERHGNDGFATFIKILRELAKQNYHYLNLSEKNTMMYLSAKCKVSIEKLEVIISDLVELGKFDKKLWTDNKIIWCQDLINSIEDAYKKRKNTCINYHGLLLLLNDLGIRKLNKLPLNKGSNTQRKVENTKKKENLENLTPHSENLKLDVIWMESISKQQNITSHQIQLKLDEFENYLKSTLTNHGSKKEFANHFVNWLAKNLKKINDEEPRINRQTADTIRKNSQGW